MIFVLLLVVGFASGVTAGLLGVGGGLVFLPFAKFYFIDYLHYPPSFLRVIVATSSVIIVSNSLGAVIAHQRHKNINLALLPYFIVATIVGARLGVLLVDYVPAAALKSILAGFLIISGARMYKGRDPKKDDRPLKKIEHVQIGFIGMLVSTLSSMLGLGGGAFMMPILNGAYHQPLKIAIGTASMFTLAVSTSACVYYFMRPTLVSPAGHFMIGYVDLQIALLVAAGGVAGSKIGARLLHKVPIARIQKIFAVLLVLAAVKMMM